MRRGLLYICAPCLAFAAEATAGFHATPEVTILSSYYARKSYGASAWDHQVGVSAVWARKWW